MVENVVLEVAAKIYGFNPERCRLLGGFNNSVFAVIIDGSEYVLKFFPASQYRITRIEAELCWIYALDRACVRVTKPLQSANGNLIEAISANKQQWFAVLFEKAAGELVDPEGERWNEQLFRNWGSVVGKIHHIAKNSELTADMWRESLDFDLKSAHPRVVARWRLFLEQLKELPTDRDSFGIIHNDLHQHNFHLDESGDLVLMDFGDFEKSWFAYDIAICMYHALQTISPAQVQDRKKFANRFLREFLRGYTPQNKIADYWLKKIPFFLNYRQTYSYLYFINHLDLNSLNKNTRDALQVMEKQIIDDTPYLAGLDGNEIPALVLE